MPVQLTEKAVSPSCVECTECGMFVDSIIYNVLNDTVGNRYCPECADELLCVECFCYVGRNDAEHSPDGELMCADCYHDEYTMCVACDDWFSKSGCTTSVGGDTYCDSCYNDNFVSCENCNREMRSNDCAVSECGISYCEDCYNRYFYTCDNCNCEVARDDIVEIDGEYFCNSCSGDRSEGAETWQARSFYNQSGCYDKVGSNRCFGVELETSSCSNHRELSKNAVWGCKHDCSVSGEEFVSSIFRGNDGLAAIDDICIFAVKNDWKVNRACGLHIHLDMREESTKTIKAITGAFRVTYDLWSSFVDNHRLENHYCAPSEWDITDLTCLSENYGIRYLPGSNNRYQWLNLAACSEHSTLEIRLHQGSIDACTIKNWVRALTVFADWASKRGLSGCIKDLGTGDSEADTRRRLAKICKIWTDAGCADLVEWFSKIVAGNDLDFSEINEDHAFHVSAHVEGCIDELVGARW